VWQPQSLAKKIEDVWFLATLCQANVWLPQFSWYVFGFCHTLATNILFLVWSICHRVIIVANFCQSLASYFLATLFMAITLLWLTTLWLGKVWPRTKHAQKVWQKLANISLYDRWTIEMMKFGNFKVWQEPNTYQIAKVWLGKLWLGTKHLLNVSCESKNFHS
jgi:hypothetical protein